MGVARGIPGVETMAHVEPQQDPCTSVGVARAPLL